MITVAPAAAQVASITIDGIAVPAFWSHGSGPRPNQPRTVLNTPVGDAAKKKRHSRTVITGGMTTGRYARALKRPRRLRSSLMRTARMIGTGKPKTRARNANQAVFRTAIPSSGSAKTRWKFWSPTKTGSDTRFVSWTLITNARTIGNHAKRPKITSIGRTNASVVRPPRVTWSRVARVRPFTRVAGV